MSLFIPNKITTSNDAVQQVVGAKGYYDCNKTAVVTTSNFTREATELAKANGVELIAKSRLQELLLQYLSENWN
jgi:HJR/Mrr/RecB family endonuclease